MEDCTKSTKRIAGNVVKTGEEAAPAVEAEASNASLSSKKTKLTSQEVKLPSLENGDSFVVSPHKTSSTSDSVSENFSTSRSSSDDVIKSADLKATSFETEVSTCNNKFSKEETSPLSEICGDSEDQTSMDKPSKTPPESHRRKPSSEEEKIPSAAEIDEFFTAAEKREQERFAEKYNYDIVNDLPLEGRYQWVRLNEASK
ncbi:hypothetical protein CUMW_160030 [Citrus unshiu]|nr:hypothetical protein CUMW_160030 [Citrus unshiu]GAY54863.1 hypothetical protein CUMW_160030 [Citrus unshiu]